MLFENVDKKKGVETDSKNASTSFNEVDMPESGVEYLDGNTTSLSKEWEDMKKRTKMKLDSLSVPSTTSVSEKSLKKSLSEYMVPKDSPERYRKQYSLSQNALDDVVGDYYDNTLKDIFEKNRKASQTKGREEYMRYVSVPGADPEYAYKTSLNVDSPTDVVNRTMESIDDEYLIGKVSPLASYGGYDAKEYVEEFVKPSLRDKMLKEYVKENTPKSSSEYIVRSAFGNSLIGKASSLGVMNGSAKEHRMLASQGVANYDSNRVEDFAAGVGSLLVDAPIFSGLGSLYSSMVGKVTLNATEKLAKEVMRRNTGNLISKEFANGVARKIVIDRLKNKILQSASVQGLTLGSYDLANSVADDILYNNTINASKAAGSFARGLVTGAAVAAVGTPLKIRSNNLTGGKKMLSSAGVLSAESAVFTLGTELDKLSNGVEVAPIDLLYDFGESTATLLAMRMSHWQPKSASDKLDSNGKIKKELKLSNSEKQEIREQNVNPEELMKVLEEELSTPSLRSGNAEFIKEKYVSLMSNDKLSAATKSKLMYLVENKLTSTPPTAFDYELEHKKNGLWKIRLYDMNGGLVKTEEFHNPGNLKSYVIMQHGEIRTNRIAYFERELTSGIESQNFLQEAGLYANENGVDVNKVAEAMYKTARKEPLDFTEQNIMNTLLERSSRYESKFNRMLYEKRRDLEKKYGLDKGELAYAETKSFVNCTSEENKALDEYELFIRTEVGKMKNGKGEQPALENDSRFLMSNSEMKQKELEEYYSIQEEKDFARNMQESKPLKIEEKMIEIAESEPGTVWNYRREKVPTERIEAYEKRGRELAEKFGHDIVFITDEHQIEVPKNKDPYSVMNYNNQLRATGWVHKGKVFINLPNVKDYSELESTIVHEVVGHAGLKKIFGRYMYDFLEDVYKTSDGSVLTGIERMKDRYRGADMYTLTEEYLVDVLEKSYPTAQERNLKYRFKDFVKSMLVRLNIYKPKYRRLSDEDVKSIMKAHCRYVLNKRDKSRHRKEVFGRFKSSDFNEGGYSDNGIYARDKGEMLNNRSYMKYTPEVLKESKYLLNYPYFPDDVKKRIAKAARMSDQELTELAELVNYRFEGEKGMRNKGKYYPEKLGERLEDAVDYEKAGVDPYHIKYLTGWERGADGKWRKEVAEAGRMVKDYFYLSLFENNPELSKLYQEIKKKPYEAWDETEKATWDKITREGYKYMKNATLENVVGDNEFFLSYPELASMPVRIVANSHSLVRYDSKNKELVVDRNLFLSPRKDAYMAGALQNVIQDYEGFSKAVSLRMLGLEGKLAERYKQAQKSILLVDEIKKKTPSFDSDSQIERAFEREYGVDIPTFKKMFPTYDDYLFYKLTGQNYSFSGDVEVNNVRKRHGYGNTIRGLSLGMNTETVPRSRQLVVENLDDLKKFFTGPLDVINDALHKLHSDEPIRLKKKYEGPVKSRFTPVELAEFDNTLDDYTKRKLRDMVNGESVPEYLRGYDEYKESMEDWYEHIRNKAEEYRIMYEDEDGMSIDDMN